MRNANILALFILIIATLANAASAPIPETLRGGIETDQKTIDLAIEIQNQGWEYVMPQPKSNQARWGNHDGRTTWWAGYWKNYLSKQTSSALPSLKDEKYEGDNQGGRSWRRGGSPGRPSILEWLLSTNGGMTPY